MKRLFLASSGLEYIKEFVKTGPKQLRVLFIPTAGNLDDKVWWIDKDRDVLGAMGFQLQELDIAGRTEEVLRASLNDTDIVYIAGGNTFYLLKQMQDTGFDKLLVESVNNGLMYAGASAGALVAGLDIKPVESIDEPYKVNGLTSTQGLGLANFVPIPHYDYGNRKDEIDAIKRQYEKDFEIVLLTDDQAIVVEGESYSIVESVRSERERQWFNEAH